MGAFCNHFSAVKKVGAF